MNRRPHPTEPDVFDDRRELAVAIFEDQAAQIETGGKTNPHASALYWLGYRKWMSGVSFTPPDSVRRRARLLNDFHGKPFHAELERHLNGIGWRRPPDREAEERLSYFEFYCEIAEDGRVLFGVRDTPGRALRFKAHCERIELVVLNGDDHVARAVAPPDNPFDGVTTIEELRLTDDDYRFEVSAVKDGWWFGQFRSLRHAGEWFDFAEIDGEWVELENQGRGWDGEWEGSERVHTAADIERSEEPEDTPGKRATQAALDVAEAERARYAERKANANMRIVAMAQRNFNGDKLHPGRGYGANWYRTLWALGYRPRVWHGSLVQPEPTAPFTAADARREQKVWDGWKPFADELERLEGIAPQEKREHLAAERDDAAHVDVEDRADGGADTGGDAGGGPDPAGSGADRPAGGDAAVAELPKVEPDPELLAEARANFKQRHSAEGGGGDWYMTLVAYGDEPEWLASTPAPETTDIVAHLRARARLWSGWNRWVADLERIERGS